MPVSPLAAQELVARLFDPPPEVRHHRTSVSTVFILRLDDGREKILKISDDPQFEAGLRREQRVLSQLRALGLAVSKIELTQDDLPDASFSFSLMPREASHSLGELWWRTPKKVASLFEDAGRWLADLHRYDPAAVPDAIGPAEARRLEAGERERIRADVEKAALDIPGVRTLFTRFEELQERPRPVLIHSDFNASQVMVAEERIAYVVDWDYTQHGRPMRDLGLCLAYTKFYDQSVERAAALFHAYDQVRALSPDEREECTLWEIYTLLRVTSAQHLVGGVENSARGLELIREAVRRLTASPPEGAS
jgi:aminoglycoside phosphotransferase (APT) family kinase protein